jgi:hypothetical protein
MPNVPPASVADAAAITGAAASTACAPPDAAQSRVPAFLATDALARQRVVHEPSRHRGAVDRAELGAGERGVR